MTFSIGFAFDTPSGPVHLAEVGANELFPGNANRQRLFDLSGPNDTLQLIADAATWAQLLKAIAAIYGAELLKEAAKKTWKERIKIAASAKNLVLGPIDKIVAALGYMKNRPGATAALVIPTSELGSQPAIDIPVHDKDEIIWRIHLMGRHADAIQKFITELTKNPEVYIHVNPDMRTFNVSPNDDGSVSISWKPKAQSTDSQSITIK